MMFDPGDRVDALAQERLDSAITHPEHLANFLDGLSKGGPIRSWFAPEDLLGIKTPTLLFHGRDDRVVPYEHSLLLLAHIPNSRLRAVQPVRPLGDDRAPRRVQPHGHRLHPEQLTPTTRRRTTPMHEAIAHIHKNADLLREEARQVRRARQAHRRDGPRPQGVRWHPAPAGQGVRRLRGATRTIFFEWVRAVAQYSPSAGWIAGVVGVHPWEIALMDPRLQEEIYGEDPDTWTASPYAPVGRAKPVEGGFLLHHRRALLHRHGLLRVGHPRRHRHRRRRQRRHARRTSATSSCRARDYEIVEGSLERPGPVRHRLEERAHDVDTFIPDYRVVEAPKMIEGQYVDGASAGQAALRPVVRLHLRHGHHVRHAGHRPRRARRLPRVHAEARVGRRRRREDRPVPAGRARRGRGRLELRGRSSSTR